MFFLKTYNTEEVCGAWFGVSGQTFQKWAWETISQLANLKAVSNKKKPVCHTFQKRFFWEKNKDGMSYLHEVVPGTPWR